MKALKVLAVMAAAVVSLGVGVSVTPMNPPAAVVTVAVQLPTITRIATIGDSTTLGSAVEGSPGPAYRAPLGALLDQAGVGHEFVAAAHAGWTCADWASPTGLAEIVATHPDIAIVNCGTNDGKVPALYAAGVIDANLRAIFAALAAIGAKILPTYIQYSAGYTGWQYGQGMVNDGVWRVTTTNLTGALLITPAVPLGFIPETTLADGGHPGAAGYRLWAGYIYRALRVVYGWPDIAPQECGMDGHRVNDPPYAVGTYLPFGGTTPCRADWATA